MKNRIIFSEKYNRLTEEETALVLEACKEVQKYVKRTPKVNRKKFRNRDVHAKGYGEVFGTLKIADSGDRYLKQVFSKSEYRAILRISNVGMVADEGKDTLPAYGIAVKLMNVAEGRDVNIPLANFPVFPTNSVSKFLKLFIRINRFASASAKFAPLAVTKIPNLLLSGISFLPNFIDASFLKHFTNILWNRNRNPLFFKYNSVGCYRFGDYIVKFMLEPKEFPKNRTDIKDKSQKVAVQEVLQKNNLTYSLKMQYCRKEDWINDLTVVWPYKKYKEIGTVSVEAGSILDPQKTESLSFSPFESPEIFKPVGRIQKTREMVYAASIAARRG